MINRFKNIYFKATKFLFDRPRRSSNWPMLSKAYLRMFPACQACGSKTDVVVHHKSPIHVNPELELVGANLITLCCSPGLECHLQIGHGGNWRHYNPNVELDARTVANDPSKRLAVIEEAKKNRRLV